LSATHKEHIEKDIEADLFRLRRTEVTYSALQTAMIKQMGLKDRIEKPEPDHTNEVNHLIQDYISELVSIVAH
jgi:hypothetical protein